MTITDDWEVAHIALAVDSLERWMPVYDNFLPGRWTSILTVDHQWETAAGDTKQVRGRAVWRSGQAPPLEVWEGPPGSPWEVAFGEARIDHIGYWAYDLEGQAAALLSAGFELEYTPARALDAELTGFGYFRHPQGFRIELQTSMDREAMRGWVEDGTALDLDWGMGKVAP